MRISLKDRASPSAWRTMSIAALLAAIAFLPGQPSATVAAETARGTTAGKITAVRAMLYHFQTGQFSNDIFPDAKAALDDALPFSSVLVVVEISGAPHTFPIGKVDLVVQRGKGKVAPDKISRQTEPAEEFSDKGRYYAAFMLRDVACDPVQITATLNGDQKSKMEKVIPLSCPSD
jgi:hypothetical protein